MFLEHFPSPPPAHAPPGVFKSLLEASLPLYFTMVSATLPKNLHTSRLKWLFSVLPLRTLLKRDDTPAQNGGSEKNFRHSRTECQFSVQLLRKRPFRARVVKAKGVSHRKIHGFGNIPDHKRPFRARVVQVDIFFNRKSGYFCSLF